MLFKNTLQQLKIELEQLRNEGDFLRAATIKRVIQIDNVNYKIALVLSEQVNEQPVVSTPEPIVAPVKPAAKKRGRPRKNHEHDLSE